VLEKLADKRPHELARLVAYTMPKEFLMTPITSPSLSIGTDMNVRAPAVSNGQRGSVRRWTTRSIGIPGFCVKLNAATLRQVDV
jgi:hypothetical protein